MSFEERIRPHRPVAWVLLMLMFLVRLSGYAGEPLPVMPGDADAVIRAAEADPYGLFSNSKRMDDHYSGRHGSSSSSSSLLWLWIVIGLLVVCAGLVVGYWWHSTGCQVPFWPWLQATSRKCCILGDSGTPQIDTRITDKASLTFRQHVPSELSLQGDEAVGAFDTASTDIGICLEF
jgi:hypothetical protein